MPSLVTLTHSDPIESCPKQAALLLAPSTLYSGHQLDQELGLVALEEIYPSVATTNPISLTAAFTCACANLF